MKKRRVHNRNNKAASLSCSDKPLLARHYSLSYFTCKNRTHHSTYPQNGSGAYSQSFFSTADGDGEELLRPKWKTVLIFGRLKPFITIYLVVDWSFKASRDNPRSKRECVTKAPWAAKTSSPDLDRLWFGQRVIAAGNFHRLKFHSQESTHTVATCSTIWKHLWPQHQVRKANGPYLKHIHWSPQTKCLLPFLILWGAQPV